MERDFTLNQRVPGKRRRIGEFRDSEILYRSLIETTGSAIFIFLKDQLLYVNHAMEILTGYPVNELLTNGLMKLVHPDHRRIFKTLTSSPLPIQDAPQPCELKIQKKDGEIRWIEFSFRQIDYNGSQVCLGTAFDITERKKADESLYQTELILRQRADELSALHALSLDIATTKDLPALLNKIVQRSVELLNAASGAIALCDEDLEQLRVAVEHLPKYRGDHKLVFKYGEGAVGWVAQTGMPLIIDDYRIWPGRAEVYENSKPYTAVLSVPMNWQGKVIGVLQVMADSETRRFTKSDEELLSLFAAQAAVAIENTRLYEAEHKRRQEADILRKATSVLTSTLDLNQVLGSLLTHLEKVVPYHGASVFLLEGTSLVIVAARGFPNPDALLGKQISSDDALFQDICQSRRPLILSDRRECSRSQRWMGLDEVRGWMSVPLMVRGEVIGCITLEHHTTHAYQEESADLVEAFANQATIAIDNARLFKAEREARERAEAIRQANLSLTTSLELSEVLDAILKSAFSLLPEAFNSHIFLYSPAGGGQLTFGAALWQGGYNGSPIAEPRQNGLTYMVARTGKAIVVPDITDHPLYAGTTMDRIGAIIGLPLKIGDQVVGVMNVSYTRPRSFAEHELQLLRLLGDQAAIAIENARLFAQAATEQRHLSLLFELGRELAASLEPKEILDKALTLTCQALDGQVGQGFLYATEMDQINLAAIYGRPEGWLEDEKHIVTLELGQGLAGWVGQNRQPVNLSNAMEDDRWLFITGLDDGVHSVISAPIVAGDRLLGVISVLHSQAGAFTAEQLTLLQAICQEVGLALSNAWRYQQAQRQLAEITFIQHLAQTFNQRLELQELLNEVATQLVAQLGYPLVEIFLIEGDTLQQRAACGVTASSDFLSMSQGIIGRVARTGQVALVLDVRQDPDYFPTYANTAAELAVPIFHGSVVVGVINIETDRLNQLTYQDRDLLKVLAGQVSIALENAVLYERLRQHVGDLEVLISERTAELVELYELSQKIGFALSPAELLRMLLSHLRNAMHCDLVFGGLYLDGQHILYVETARPILPAAMDQLNAYWLDIIQMQGHPDVESENLPVEVITADAYNTGNDPLMHIGSLIHIPIRVADNLVGILIAGNEKEQAFGEAHTRILDTFANQAIAAIQRLRALLAAEQKRLEGLVEHLPLGVLLLDSEYRLLMANPLGRSILDVLNPGFTTGQLHQLGPLGMSELVDHQTDLMPLEIVQQRPTRRVFIAQARPAGEDSHQWVVTVREATQEREHQGRIQMQERLATVGQLAAGIAHDFNNIMAAILVYTNLLTDAPDIPPTSRERLLIIEQQVQRAASLIRQILDFSRRSVMEQSNLDLLPFIKELDKMLRRVLPETIQLELSYRSGNYLVRADPTRLQQAFLNLALNSRDAMPKGGLLQFELNRIVVQEGERAPITDMGAGEWVRIIIKDTGKGIRTDQLPHIFEPFFTTKPIGQGTGLGLAQVYGIIKQHDGFIDVKSRVGQGTTFTIYLPVRAESEMEEPMNEPSVKLDGVGKSVLVVEDDMATREALQALLESHRYNVKTARNGLEAVQMLEENQRKFDLVVSDIVMPQMGGVALYRTIQERWPRIKMLLVTGHPLDGENQAMLEAGKTNWLQKPFSANTFNQAVFQLLSE